MNSNYGSQIDLFDYNYLCNAVNIEYQREKEKIKQDVERAIETINESEQKLQDAKDLAEKSLIQVQDQKEKLGKMDAFINKMPDSSHYAPSSAISGHMETLSSLVGSYAQNANRQLFVISNALGDMRVAYASTTVASGTLDSSGNGKKLLAEISIKTLTDTKEMWLYNKNLGYWERAASNYIQTYCGSFDELCKNSAFNNLLTFIQGQTWVNRIDFEENEDYINVENGVVKIDTGKLLAHDSKFNFKSRLEIFYNPDAKCPKFLELINNALPESDRLLLQELFGYAISNIIAKYAFFLQGVLDSGKTTIARILIILLGGTSKVSGYSLATLSDREGAGAGIKRA